ncbi:SRPBCC family protein [Amycolatopsis sp. NPDC054798]
MTDEPSRVVRASREIEASAERIFELIAEPSQQPSWDGNDNLAEAEPGQRVHAVGDVFTTILRNGKVRENHVVEFEEARRLAWRPAETGKEPAGHLWRWELNPLGATRTEVTHTYDWSDLSLEDTRRVTRARSTTADSLRASLENLAKAAELSQS